MPGDTTRWTVSVSRETDIGVRTDLAGRGMKKGDLSTFIEDAARWRVPDQTILAARGKFVDMTSDDLAALIDAAVAETRGDPGPKAG